MTAEPLTGSPAGTPYHRLAQGAAWRPLVGIPLLGILVLVGSALAGLLVSVVARAGGGEMSVDPINPAGLAAVNLGWAIAIPATVLVAFAIHGLRPGRVASVAGRIRWGWLVRCLGLALLALIATVVVGTLLPQEPATEIGGEVNAWSTTIRDFVLVVVLLTPLQAAGEEYAFRGYLTQAFGGLLGGRTATAVAVVVPALLFALAHGAQSAPVFVDRFAFGLVAGTLTILTGGIEAGIAMHVLNNWAAFGIALAFTDMDTAISPDGGSWWTLPSTLTQSLVYLAIVVWAARRRGLRTVAGGPGDPVLASEPAAGKVSRRLPGTSW